MRLHHSSFPVRDLQRSLEFYEGVLGLQRAPRPDLGIPGVWLEVGDGQIHLIEVADPNADVGRPPGFANPMGRHTALAVDDLQATIDHLAAAGLQPAGMRGSSTQCWVQDPDGHVIEFIQVR
jgi:glyoxylase I family protein